MPEKTRVVLMDDHPTYLEGLACLLQYSGEFEVVGTAADRAAIFALLEQAGVDVVILDLLMPEPGLTILDDIRLRALSVRVLMLSACEDIHQVRSAIQHGAEGFIFKTQPLQQIKDAIRQVAQGNLIFPKTVQPLITQTTKKDDLSERELEVLACVASGLTNLEISEKLAISRHTVGFHIKSIFTKLNVNNRTEATIWYFKHRSSFD
jgi:DNA-binding NarL/FixJ family response regulator